VIKDNSIWLLGNGENINFWLDKWCGDPLVEQLHIPVQFRHSLSSSVSDFIFNGHWNIPSQLSTMFSNLNSIVSKVLIPMEACNDNFLWKHSDSGDLELKQAYIFKSQHVQDLHWAKQIWNIAIPPSKSLMVWRLMHDKMPTDEKLMERGCAIPSMCNLCKKSCGVFFPFIFRV
jgi:hypothetical protein